MPLSTTPLTVTTEQDNFADLVAAQSASTSGSTFTQHGNIDAVLAGGTTGGAGNQTLSLASLVSFIQGLGTLSGTAVSWITLPDGWRRGLLDIVKAIAVSYRNAEENYPFFNAVTGFFGATSYVTNNGVVAGLNFLQAVNPWTIAGGAHQLPTATGGLAGYIAWTSDGGPTNTGSVGGPSNITVATGAPGLVFCDGTHWYNTIGINVH